MNEIAAYARPVPRGFWGMIRLHRDAKPKPLMARGGSPIVYACEADALRAVLANLCSYMNSPMYRDGAMVEAVSEADSHFNLKPFVKAKGSQRRTVVERVGERV